MAARLGEVLCVAVAIAFSTSARANAASQDPARIERCMLTVLKNIPGVEVIDTDAPPRVMAYNFPYFFVKYRFQGHVIGFAVEKNRFEYRDTYTWVTNLPSGLESIPDDWGTGAILRKWKAQCDATAIVFED